MELKGETELLVAWKAVLVGEFVEESTAVLREDVREVWTEEWKEEWKEELKVRPCRRCLRSCHPRLRLFQNRSLCQFPYLYQTMAAAAVPAHLVSAEPLEQEAQRRRTVSSLHHAQESFS